ncbi:MAG: hypothetical protein MUE69_22010 [Myxococcota bacterium]|nr:hypothetical protein [Myxococcota bacterium]
MKRVIHVGYRDRFIEICRASDWDAALGFLRSIFHDPANQRARGNPTDFLDDDDDDDEKVTAAEGFDQIVAGFTPRETVAQRVEFLLECLNQSRAHHEPRHVFQPFNLLQFRVDSYERCDVRVFSMHDAADGRAVRQFGLYHTIVHGHDSHEEYRFTYKLQTQYSFAFDGQAISGALLHYDTKLVIFARWLVKLVEELIAHEDFARFPKTLPFRVEIVGEELDDAEGFAVDLVAPVTEASLVGHPRRAAWLEAAVIHGDTGIEAQFLYALPALAELDGELGHRLTALLVEHATLRAVLARLGEAAVARLVERDGPSANRITPYDDSPTASLEKRAAQLVRRESPLSFARALRAAGDRAGALALEEKILTLPLPAEWPERRDEAASLAHEEVSRRFEVWSSIPEEDRPVLAAAWQGCLAALHQAGRTEPLVALFLFERQTDETLDAPKAVDDWGDDEGTLDDGERDPLLAFDPEERLEPWPGAWLDHELARIPRGIRALGDSPPAGYVELVLDVVRHSGPEMGSYDGLYQVLEQRLLALGPRAASGLPDVLAWAERWCAGLTGQFHAQLATHFGRLLMWMGLEDVPAFVHAAHRDDPYMMEDFYPRWAAEVPRRRIAKFVDAFHADSTPFESSSAWDEVIYDSPPGIKMLVHAITGTKKTAAQVETDVALARLAVAARRPSPLVTRLIFQIADHFAGNAWPKVRTLLEAHPRLDAERAELLRLARTYDVVVRLDAGHDVTAETARLREQYPEHAMPRYLAARRLLEQVGSVAAVEATREALRVLSAADVVYRKAVFQYGGARMDRWNELAPSVLHAFLRIAIDHCHERAYRGGVFDGRTESLDFDPFYAAFKHVVSAYTPPQLAEELAGWRAELAFSVEMSAVSDEVLCRRVDGAPWPVAWQIAQRLAATPGDEPWRVGTVLQIWGRFAEAKERRLALAKLLWPIEAWRRCVVLDERVKAHLPWWIDVAPGSTPLDVARGVFAAMLEAKAPERVTELVKELRFEVVVNTFLSIAPAFQQTGDFVGAVTLLTQILAVTSPKRPDYVLTASNLAVFQMQAGMVAEGEATLDALFSRDWSRFDYRSEPHERDLGLGDLDEQYAQTFRVYYAMAKFNAACLYAQTHRPDLAVAALREATALHPAYYTPERLLAETDFAPLRTDATFTSLLTSLGGAA